ncbi:MerR family transcriptional regulator [Apilactobacillus ozensis]|uniref:MerR family transcriptional regulator n=1 Tax=Apilactobacillus ozensis TaxID=866801 RepID=UPI00200AE806|nr:MerR family transcriptional regulator [Apilactobacillus ozensis]MCK8607264.1 MerR family transcriptional regulator [Apilactobacillus ozensis]
MEKYTIGEFAKKVGLTTYTLRYYEQQQLIMPRRDDHQRRYYTDEDVKWLGFLICLKNTGMTMAEIGEYVQLRSQGDKTMEARKNLLAVVKKRSDDQIKDMQANLKVVKHKIDWYNGKMDCSIDQDEDFESYLARFNN